MRKEVLLLNGGGAQVAGVGINQCMEKSEWRNSVGLVF
jgi:hypothetical protein